MPQTRRTFLGQAGRLGVVAAGLAAARHDAWLPTPVAAQELTTLESIAVLMGDVRLLTADILAQTGRGAVPGWRTSATIEAERPFTHLGLHWSGAQLSRLEVRTSHDDVSWSPWQPVTVESRPADNPRAEWFAALLGAPRHTLAQYRFPQRDPLPEQLTLTYLNSLDGPRSTTGQAVAQIPVDKGVDLRTAVITREEWGADESLRFSESGEEVWPRAYVPPRMVVVHHTATRNFSEDPAADVRSIYAFHAVTQGWGDIAYSALIDPEGRIYEGRRGRDVDPFGRLPRDVVSYGVVGAHATGHNYGSASVALLGNHQEAPPTEAAWRALEEVLVFLHRRYEIDPRASIDFARSTDLWRYDLPTLPGHRDCTPTECPGDYVYQRLPALRARVAERINGGAPTPLAIIQSPPTRNIWLGTASYRWERAAPYDCVFEGFWKHPGEDPVDYLRGYDEQAMPEHIVTRQTEASFDLREPGQYTLHLRPAGQSFADRVTVVVDRHVVRDNADLEGVHRTEGWTRSQSVKEFYGSDYEVAVAGSGAEFSWQLPVPESGPYRVQACWASAPEHTRTAAYAVAADGEVLDTITVNQSLRGAVWTTLGTFDFVAGQTCEVTLTAPAADEEYIVVADAVRIVMEV